MPTPSAQPLVSDAALQRAERNLRDVLRLAIEHTHEQAALVIADHDCELARSLAAAYRRVLPGDLHLEFARSTPAEILARFEALAPGDLVVLIQSTSFRLDAFRIRLELFKRSLKVIEHPHLARMGGAEAETYIDALAYDQDYYHGVGRALKQAIDQAQRIELRSEGACLRFDAPMETAKLNIGDYSELPNVGGQYPIGEVFSECSDLSAVSGQLRISFFGDTSFRVNRPAAPITLVVEQGRVVQARDATPEFDAVLDNIRADEGVVWLRELGFGLNRAFNQERTVSDIGSFERMCGVHLSLGAKHASYNKPEIRKRAARHHVDVFALTDSVLIDGREVFRAGAWSP